jgi:hypothetical protein
MSATAARPPDADLDMVLDDPSRVWVHVGEYVLGMPMETSQEEMQRAFEALQWISRPPPRN